MIFVAELTAKGFMAVITEFVRECGSQKCASARLGVSEQYLCDVLKGRRQPGPALLDGIGYERVMYYRQV